MSTALLFTLALIAGALALSFVGDALARQMKPCPRRAVLRVGWWFLSFVCSAGLWVLVVAYADRWAK